MESSAGQYKISRTCNNCGNYGEIWVSKKEAAFELVDINEGLGNICEKCSAASFNSYWTRPGLDLELLTAWAQDASLSLMEQDEDLLLAEEKYLEDILTVLDTANILDHKRNVLMEALCAMVYNNSVNTPTLNGMMLKKRVIGELNKRLDTLKLADGWIMDYMKKVVYPQLNPDK